jgi:hypothetical protein
MKTFKVIKNDGQTIEVVADAMRVERNTVVLFVSSGYHDVAAFYKPVSVVQEDT